jgi:hypothetical protein
MKALPLGNTDESVADWQQWIHDRHHAMICVTAFSSVVLPSAFEKGPSG